jgi:hypothetical protein
VFEEEEEDEEGEWGDDAAVLKTRTHQRRVVGKISVN